VKASSILGLIVGGIGSWKTISLMGLLLPAAFFSPINWPVIVFIIILLLFGGPLAFASALCLVLLVLTDEQNHILGFLSFVGSISILIVLPFFLLASSP